MRGSTNRSQSWRVRLDFLARLRNKFNQKVDKFFVNHYFPEQGAAPPPTDGSHPWSTPFDQYAEASGSNHTSTPNSQYFDAVDAAEYLQQHQRFEFPPLDVQAQTSPGTIPPSTSDATLGMYTTDGNIVQMYHPLPQHQSFLGDFDLHQQQDVPMSVTDYDMEFSDAVAEMHEPWPGTSHGYGAPGVSMQMSGDTMETADSDMMDTGSYSNFTGYVLPPHPVPHQRALTVADIKHILFGDEAESRFSGRRLGFRVVASIVYAYRKLRGLVRRRRMQRCSTPSAMSGEGSGSCKILKRIRSAECSRLYQGIKQRKGKWVAEIRVSKMPDKVWLGSFPSEKQAALAYDAGLHHCNLKRTKVFNFKESPHRLGPSQYVNLAAMTKDDRKVTVQTLANDYAMAYGSS